MTRIKLKRFQYEMLTIVLCWRTNGFESWELFRRKFRKHAKRDFGIDSQWLYLWKADSRWRGKSFPANHLGAPLGNPEHCLRQENLTFARRDNKTAEISFLQRNLIQTYYAERDREEFLSQCSRI